MAVASNLIAQIAGMGKQVLKMQRSENNFVAEEWNIIILQKKKAQVTVAMGGAGSGFCFLKHFFGLVLFFNSSCPIHYP